MQTIATIGLDIAKSVFQVHGVDAEGNVTLRRQLKMCIRDRCRHVGLATACVDVVVSGQGAKPCL